MAWYRVSRATLASVTFMITSEKPLSMKDGFPYDAITMTVIATREEVCAEEIQGSRFCFAFSRHLRPPGGAHPLEAAWMERTPGRRHFLSSLSHWPCQQHPINNSNKDEEASCRRVAYKSPELILTARLHQPAQEQNCDGIQQQPPSGPFALHFLLLLFLSPCSASFPPFRQI